MISLVLLAVLCTASSQFVQALAARRLNQAQSGSRLLKEPLVYAAYALLALGLVFWLIALTELDVSQTYPLFALGFVLTMLFARFGLGEVITRRGILGAGLIVMGSLLCNL